MVERVTQHGVNSSGDLRRASRHSDTAQEFDDLEGMIRIEAQVRQRS
jgi:hypothetical protein